MEGLDEEAYKEIKELRKVLSNNGSKVYAEAQLRIGTVLYENNYLDEALLVWRNIESKDDTQAFIKAQWNISVCLSDNGNAEEAFVIWENFKKTEDPQIYAQAQWNIGLALDQSDNPKRALSAWRNITLEDDPAVYGQAQLHIGLILHKKNDIQGALSAWRSFERIHNPEKYAKARLMIGLVLDTNNDINGALAALQDIDSSDDSQTYYKAQFIIGFKLIKQSEYRDILTAKKSFENIRSYYSFESYCLINICNMLLSSSTKSIGEYYLLVYLITLEITKLLRIDFEQRVTDNQPVERKLAHYTNTDVSNELLKEDSGKGIYSSSFRLNTINNVNDPSEGQVLFDYLDNIKKPNFEISDFDKDFHAFVGCFSLNHDSLNQFRLYGKRDRQEASGISLVFKKDFFDLSSEIENIKNISINSILGKSEDNNYEIGSSYLGQLQSIPDKVNRFSKHLDIQRIMRCVYIDPVSGYFQLAQRSRLTFYREFEEEDTAQLEWESYENLLNKKNERFSFLFKSLKVQYKSLIESLSLLEDKSELNIEPSKFLDTVVLPLKYLIKHSAFQEEQECRMIYTTSLDRPEVQMEFGKFLYVEYEVDVKSHLDKVYIAPAATQYQPYLAKLLCDTNVKIELSNNPYRQT